MLSIINFVFLAMEPFEISVRIDEVTHTFLVFDVEEDQSFNVFNGETFIGSFKCVICDDRGTRWETDHLVSDVWLNKIGDAIEHHWT